MDGLKELHPTPEFQDECDAKEYPSKSNSDQAISSDQGPAGRQPVLQLLALAPATLRARFNGLRLSTGRPNELHPVLVTHEVAPEPRGPEGYFPVDIGLSY